MAGGFCFPLFYALCAGRMPDMVPIGKDIFRDKKLPCLSLHSGCTAEFRSIGGIGYSSEKWRKSLYKVLDKAAEGGRVDRLLLYD